MIERLGVNEQVLAKGDTEVLSKLLDERVQEQMQQAMRVRAARVPRMARLTLGRVSQARYVGVKQEKRKIRKISDRKFVFDWDAGEDTSADINPLYTHRKEYSMFGRGHLAGFDINEQLKKRSQFYKELVDERQTNEEKERAMYAHLCFSPLCRALTRFAGGARQ